jgi:hypothetical protein
MEITKFGNFTGHLVRNDLNILLFEEDTVEFIPTVSSLPTTASVSIESSLKARMVTTAPSSITEIGQLCNNALREHLSKDPFLRVGFNEPDKLWEVLKAYAKYSKHNDNTFMLSLDLKEATYTMSHELMECNLTLLDRMLRNYRPWLVYHRVFKILFRDVDMSNLQKQGYFNRDMNSIMRTERGSFMGDVLSFIHLTVTLSALVNMTSIQLALSSYYTKDVYRRTSLTRPIGQSVGDDLILLGIDEFYGVKFNDNVNHISLRTSKLNALSQDTFTFCEQYGCRYTEGDPGLSQISKESKFGDLIFLDTLKGSLFTSKSKVKSDGSDPFMGHAKMLNQQLSYLNDNLKKTKAKVFLWVLNYRNTARLGRAKPHLPYELGGMDIAVGNCDDFRSKLMTEKYIPYFARMLELPQDSFLKYYTLLNGIYRVSPKGYSWSNDEDAITYVVSNCTMYSLDQLGLEIPDFIKRKGQGDINRYISNTLGFISVSMLADELVRRESYLNFWKGIKSKSFVTRRPTDCEKRHNDIWATIRNELSKSELHWSMTSFSKIASEFRVRTLGWYVKRDDRAIQDAFLGSTSMYLRY